MAEQHTYFCCHTLLHVLVATARGLRRQGQPTTLVLSESTIPTTFALKARLENLCLRVLTVDEEKLDTQNNESNFYRLRHPFREKYFTLPKGEADNRYYISNDWSALGRYFQREKMSYILGEDTVGGTLDPDQHLLEEQRSKPAGPYLYWGDSPFCIQVESEDAAQCKLFPPKKLVTFSKRKLLESLTDGEKAAVLSVFLDGGLPEITENSTLLLPRSFVLDGLMTQDEQDRMFAAVAKKYTVGTLFIKTHPRDETDYQALFPDAVILPRTMPSEVLNFCLPFRFARAVTVQSWVLRGFTAAEEQIFVSLEDAKALI